MWKQHCSSVCTEMPCHPGLITLGFPRCSHSSRLSFENQMLEENAIAPAVTVHAGLPREDTKLLENSAWESSKTEGPMSRAGLVRTRWCGGPDPESWWAEINSFVFWRTGRKRKLMRKIILCCSLKNLILCAIKLSTVTLKGF